MHKPLKRYALLRALLLVVLVGFAMRLNAQPASIDQPMKLRVIMEALDHDMQAVTGAISKEDWELVAELASKISNHAEPPQAEKGQILIWLGADARKFRDFDVRLQKEAAEMGEAAKQADGEKVIAKFSDVQQSCLACHTSFRQPFVKQFYGNH